LKKIQFNPRILRSDADNLISQGEVKLSKSQVGRELPTAERCGKGEKEIPDKKRGLVGNLWRKFNLDVNRQVKD